MRKSIEVFVLSFSPCLFKISEVKAIISSSVDKFTRRYIVLEKSTNSKTFVKWSWLNYFDRPQNPYTLGLSKFSDHVCLHWLQFQFWEGDVTTRNLVIVLIRLGDSLFWTLLQNFPSLLKFNFSTFRSAVESICPARRDQGTKFIRKVQEKPSSLLLKWWKREPIFIH